MTTINSSDFKKDFDCFFDIALREPVIIQKHHRNSVVMLSYDTFDKLQARIAELEDYKLVQEMEKIKKNGTFIGGKEAIDKLTAMIKK